MKLNELFEGYSIQPSIDPERYGPLPGLEGPFRHKKTGEVLYYDPKEGKYYNRDSDWYVDYGLEESDTAYYPDEGEIVRDTLHQGARYVVQYVSGDAAVVQNFPGSGADFEISLKRIKPLKSRSQKKVTVPISSLIEIALAYSTAYFNDYDLPDLWSNHIIPNFIRLYHQSNQSYSPEVEETIGEYEFSEDTNDLLPVFDSYGAEQGFNDWFGFLADYVKQ